MVSGNFVIKNETGLHARPASVIVKEASKFSSEIVLKAAGKEANLKSIMAVMSLGLAKGTDVVLEANGEDEAAALEAMGKIVESQLD